MSEPFLQLPKLAWKNSWERTSSNCASQFLASIYSGLQVGNTWKRSLGQAPSAALKSVRCMVDVWGVLLPWQKCWSEDFKLCRDLGGWDVHCADALRLWLVTNFFWSQAQKGDFYQSLDLVQIEVLFWLGHANVANAKVPDLTVSFLYTLILVRFKPTP